VGFILYELDTHVKNSDNSLTKLIAKVKNYYNAY